MKNLKVILLFFLSTFVYCQEESNSSDIIIISKKNIVLNSKQEIDTLDPNNTIQLNYVFNKSGRIIEEIKFVKDKFGVTELLKSELYTYMNDTLIKIVSCEKYCSGCLQKNTYQEYFYRDSKVSKINEYDSENDSLLNVLNYSYKKNYKEYVDKSDQSIVQFFYDDSDNLNSLRTLDGKTGNLYNESFYSKFSDSLQIETKWYDIKSQEVTGTNTVKKIFDKEKRLLKKESFGYMNSTVLFFYDNNGFIQKIEFYKNNGDENLKTQYSLYSLEEIPENLSPEIIQKINTYFTSFF